jgi:FkbM family methyltransferase
MSDSVLEQESLLALLKTSNNLMEAVRCVVRRTLRPQSRLYRAASRFLTDLRILQREGPLFLARCFKYRRATDGVAVLHSRHLLHPFQVRLGMDDLDVFLNNVVREEYGQLPRKMTPSVIVDAGAYIGDTSCYFLSRFPSARVVALEPNAATFPQALANLAPYGSRAALEPYALWSKEAVLQFGGAQTGAGVGRGCGTVRGVSLPWLLERYGIERVDILKMDIEGAEREVLNAASLEWLARVEGVLVETHGPEFEACSLAILRRAGFKPRRFRNVWYCFRETRGEERPK